jgi:dihydroneopterin aldolase
VIQLDVIAIKGIRVRGRHGALTEERDFGLDLEVDLSARGDFRTACATDQLAEAVDYTQICRTVVEIAESKPCHLLEHLAERLAEGVLQAFAVEEVEVTVSKRPTGVVGLPERFSVTIVRRRSPQW